MNDYSEAIDVSGFAIVEAVIDEAQRAALFYLSFLVRFTVYSSLLSKEASST